MTSWRFVIHMAHMGPGRHIRENETVFGGRIDSTFHFVGMAARSGTKWHPCCTRIMRCDKKFHYLLENDSPLCFVSTVLELLLTAAAICNCSTDVRGQRSVRIICQVQHSCGRVLRGRGSTFISQYTTNAMAILDFCVIWVFKKKILSHYCLVSCSWWIERFWSKSQQYVRLLLLFAALINIRIWKLLVGFYMGGAWPHARHFSDTFQKCSKSCIKDRESLEI